MHGDIDGRSVKRYRSTRYHELIDNAYELHKSIRPILAHPDSLPRSAIPWKSLDPAEVIIERTFNVVHLLMKKNVYSLDRLPPEEQNSRGGAIGPMRKIARVNVPFGLFNDVLNYAIDQGTIKFFPGRGVEASIVTFADPECIHL